MFGGSLFQRASLRNAVYLLDLDENARSSHNLLAVTDTYGLGWGIASLRTKTPRKTEESRRNQIFSDIIGPSFPEAILPLVLLVK